jgi:hypothetical protein
MIIILKKALTNLNLSINQIGDRGVQYLACALKDNTVKLNFDFYIAIYFIFIIHNRHLRY